MYKSGTLVRDMSSIAFINRSDIGVSALWSCKRIHGYIDDAQHQQQGNVDTRERTYVCADCGKSYAVKRSLWRHRKFECVNAKPRFSCDICSYKSPHKWCINKHRKKHHEIFYNHFSN
ncbi:longitudinals lacking protein, isoforms F/I/K/T-like [Monomorium pharaonis]|uniref:longitudinals lacking protein, isoforms F/I/K/T-like n=1 Tax=Monomorium pharaonis TaxID=307658 RepID=UPI001745EEF1|nr:longitudinals lacking protein, isoforms F/I/K/T-like [Monomorium pharaonis]